MRAEVDQSGKVESTKMPTVLAFANTISCTIHISTQVKKDCHQYLKEKSYPPKTRHLRLFAAALVLLIKDRAQQIDQLVIDTEYRGSEKNLKLAIKNALRRAGLNFNLDKITFAQIGKRSNAHILAVGVLRKRREPDKRISFGEIRDLL